MNEHHQPFEEVRHYGKGRNFGQLELGRYWIIGTGNFIKVLARATQRATAQSTASDHFVETTKMVKVGLKG